MSGILITPRVEVFWGKVNLTSYDGKDQSFPQGEPLAYDVETSFQSESSGPTASLKWNPSGPAAFIYEDLVGKQTDQTFTIKWYYAEGKYLLSKWVWGGQSMSYGNNMDIKVTLLSELAGVVNASTRSISHANTKPSTFGAGNSLLHKSFGVDEKYTALSPAANKVMSSGQYWNQYGKDVTFGSSLTNLGAAAGVYYTPSNIDNAKMVGFVPFIGEDNEEVLDASSVQPGKSPDPAKRYGYLLGPSLISTMERTTNWKPPQQTNGAQASTRPRVNKKQTLKQNGVNNAAAVPKPVAATQESFNTATSAPIGTSSALNLNVATNDKGKGVDLNNLKNQEQGSQLTFSTFMVPVLTGIKPNDIVYIPSLTGKYIEDWIVQSVSYSQTDGAVTINVSASRVYGLVGLMQERPGKLFKEKAAKLTTLEAWEQYAWGGLRGSGTTNPQDTLGNKPTAAEERFFNPTLPPTVVTPGLLGGL